MSGIVVDSSAIVSLLLGEDDGSFFAEQIAGEQQVHLSIASFLETSIVVRSRRPEAGAVELEKLLKASRMILEPVTLRIGFLAEEASRASGRGSHLARLNFGDCLVYATAKELNLPLLCKGNDFVQTDLPCITPNRT